MKKSTSNQTSMKIFCDIFGHKYEVSKKVTSHVKEYTCRCCKKQLTTAGDGHLTELTPKYREINKILEEIYARRMVRNQPTGFTQTAFS